MNTELKTLQEAKDHGARYAGYKNWDEMFDFLGAHTLSSAKYSQVNVAIEAAMEYCYEQGLKADGWIYLSEKSPETVGWYQVLTNDEMILIARVVINGFGTIPFGKYYGDMGPNFVKGGKEVEREVIAYRPLPPLSGTQTT